MNDDFIISIDKLEYHKSESNVSIGSGQRFLFKTKVAFTLLYLLFRELVLGFIRIFQCKKPENVSGQLCLITGGANGLGRTLALKFAKEGCNIAIVDIVDTESAVQEIRYTYGVNCQGFHCDISDTKSVELLRKEVECSMGPVDILVNNAGLLYMGHILQCSIEAIQKCIDVNLVSHFKVI